MGHKKRDGRRGKPLEPAHKAANIKEFKLTHSEWQQLNKDQQGHAIFMAEALVRQGILTERGSRIAYRDAWAIIDSKRALTNEK